MTAKKEMKINLPKVPNWLEQSVGKERAEYRYFRDRDKVIEKSVIALVLKGEMTGVML